MSNEIKWKDSEQLFSSGTIHGWLGKVPSFSLNWNSAMSREDPDRESKRWTLECGLPGIKSNLGNYPTREIAQKKAELVLNLWLEIAGLQIKE